MIDAAARLIRRVLGWQILFTLAVSSLVSLLAPPMLLLRNDIAVVAGRALLLAILAGGAVTLFRSWWSLRRHRFVLRVLALGSRSVEPFEMQELEGEPWHVTLGWVGPSFVALGLVATIARPGILDLTTGISLGLLGAVIVAAASLPLHVFVRSAVLRAIELSPPEVMREVAEAAQRSGAPRRKVARRLLAAVATPVAFVAIGSALIANAHLRRADERQREETARALARSAFEIGPGVVPGAGLEGAIDRAAKLGFIANVAPDNPASYAVERDEDGVVDSVTPLDTGSAEVRFSGSTISVLSFESLLISLLAMGVAALLGVLLGRALGVDLSNATRGVRLLGTEAVISGGTRVVRPARFRVVAELGQAIERLADRFRVFARAQERAIEARAATTRMRGLFFASVSHDLKSPLNAILGFTELVRQLEPVSAGQIESLDMIERRGRELLALIETILDAARVEAGQLTLIRDRVKISDLLGQAIEKGRDLGGDRPVEVVGEISEGIPELEVDRLQIGRALATLIGHAMRSAERGVVRVKASPGSARRLHIAIDLPSRRFSARQLEAMLDPTRKPGASVHRGLALGMSLARSVVELHGGRVRVEDLGVEGARFMVRLPIDSDAAAIAPADASSRFQSSRPPGRLPRS